MAATSFKFSTAGTLSAASIVLWWVPFPLGTPFLPDHDRNDVSKVARVHYSDIVRNSLEAGEVQETFNDEGRFVRVKRDGGHFRIWIALHLNKRCKPLGG